MINQKNKLFGVLILGCLFVFKTGIIKASVQSDSVLLRNGSLIKGRITDLILNESVKIQTMGGSIFVFNFSEIEKIIGQADSVYLKNGSILKNQNIGLDQSGTIKSKSEDGSIFTLNIPEIDKFVFSSTSHISPSQEQSINYNNFSETKTVQSNSSNFQNTNFQKNTFLINFGVKFSLSAKVAKMDPFLGGGISYQHSNWRFNGSILFGKAKLLNLPDYPGVEVKFDSNDILYGLTVDYMFTEVFKNELKNAYFAVGGGYYYENIKFEGDITIDIGYGFPPITTQIKEDFSGGSFVIEGIAGYAFKRGEIFAKYLHYVKSENVASSIFLGLGIRIK